MSAIRSGASPELSSLALPTAGDDFLRNASSLHARSEIRSKCWYSSLRPQHAIGEVAAVGRIRESLRLERQARMRPVMLAVQAGRGTVEGRRAVELDAGLGREQAHRQPVLRRTQRRDLRETVLASG